MSGGYFNGSGFVIKSKLEEIAYDENIVKRFPNLSNLFIELGKVISKIEIGLDYDISGDKLIVDDIEFEKAARDELLKVVEKNN